MPATFTRINKHEFNEFMEDNEFVCINDEQARQELIYAFMWHDGTYMIKIFSSIVPRDGEGRSKGKDAIRLVLFLLIDGEYKPVWKAARVHRTQGWRDNLQNRINEALNRGRYKREYKCKICSAPMLGRYGKWGFFWGCSMYGATECPYTINEGN
jgi:hypothetical protein